MIIEISDEVAKKCDLSEREALELLAVAIYKAKGIHGSLAGKLLGVSELEFHRLLAKQGATVNYDVQDLIDDLESNRDR